jgi:hypothetical protein
MVTKLSPREKAALATQMMNKAVAPLPCSHFNYRSTISPDQLGSDWPGNGWARRQSCRFGEAVA